MGHHSQKCEFLMTLTHAQYYKFLNIQKLNYLKLRTGGKILKSYHNVMIDGGRVHVALECWRQLQSYVTCLNF